MSTKINSVASKLGILLADSYQLMSQTHLAHWNVRGSDFFSLHEAFQGQYEELFTAIDDIAERIRALDTLAPGGLNALAKHSAVKESKIDLSAKDFVSHLLKSHEQLLINAIATRNIAAESEDAETEDLVIGRIQAHQKTIWMLKSYLG